MEITKLESIINELREEEVEPFIKHILAYLEASLEHWEYKQKLFRKKDVSINRNNR
jgi:hypothetical protein